MLLMLMMLEKKRTLKTLNGTIYLYIYKAKISSKQKPINNRLRLEILGF